MPVPPKVDCCHDGSCNAKDNSYKSARVDAVRVRVVRREREGIGDCYKISYFSMHVIEVGKPYLC
jgi:hypothetical protein